MCLQTFQLPYTRKSMNLTLYGHITLGFHTQSFTGCRRIHITTAWASTLWNTQPGVSDSSFSSWRVLSVGNMAQKVPGWQELPWSSWKHFSFRPCMGYTKHWPLWALDAKTKPTGWKSQSWLHYISSLLGFLKPTIEKIKCQTLKKRGDSAGPAAASVSLPHTVFSGKLDLVTCSSQKNFNGWW